jgi:hypothetical protein
MTEPREVDRPSSECGSTVIAPLWMLWRGRRFVSAARHPSEQKERGQLCGTSQRMPSIGTEFLARREKIEVMGHGLDM